MNTLVALPLLALVAAYSCEAAFDTYTSLNESGVLNAFPVTVELVDEQGNLKEGNANFICPIGELDAGTSSCEPISYDNADYLKVTFDTSTIETADNMDPVSVMTRACFSPLSQVNRKWRKSKPEFKKDKHCTINAGNIEAKADYVADSEMMLRMQIPSWAGSAFMSVQVYVKCAGQGDNEWCAVSDTLAADKTFFEVKVIDSRGTELWVITLVLAFIGPIFFISFLIYERGVLAKRA